MLNYNYKIYIIQMYTRTVFSRFIRLITHYPYSHIVLSFDKNCYSTYSFGRRKPNSILNAGFVMEKQGGAFFKKFNKTDCRIYELEITESKFKKMKDIIKNMEIHSKEYKYDYFGIFYRFLNIPITFKNKYVCSYFVADLLEKTDVYKFNKKTCFIAPKDFESIKGIKEIYTGKYLMYQGR